MALKLIKVAKDFNVGLHTIVETLRAKGFSGVEEKPTAEISDEMLDVLQREFKGDMAIKKEADKLARPVLKKESVTTPGTMPPVSPEAAPPAPRPNLLPPREEAPKVVLPKKEEPELHQRERPALRVVGKIDLDAPSPAPAPKVEEPAKPVEQPVEAPVKAETAPPPPPPAPLVEEQKSATGQVEAPPPPPQESKAEVPPAPEEPSGESDFYRADSPQLRGLKILGRVNLEQKKEPAPPSNDRNRGAAGNNRGRDQRGGNQGGRGGNPQQGQPNRGGPGGQQQPGQPNRTGPPGSQPATGSAADAEKRRRKRKKVQQPITAEAIQASLSGTTGDKKGKPRQPESKEVSTKEIEEQIRKTMTRMGAGASRKRQKMRRDKRDNIRERAELAEQAELDGGKRLQVTEFVSVSDLASLMNVRPADIIKACMSLGIFVSINQRLDAEIIEVVASEFGYEVEFISAEEQVEVVEEEIDNPDDLRSRQPIVTVMGHVDHGKTSLLDFIRNANVAGGEAGGITQHIGAYEVMVGEGSEARRITFLDTPGHEAFTAMRARGAKVTDIAIIVVAADDSIMPQTREAISHAQAAGVPLVFAINKIDKNGADPERIKNELAQMNLLVEEWGGKYQSQDISAKLGLNVDKLLEKVLLEAELLDLKANPARRATGTVLEASLDKGRGYVTKVLVENGTLDEGDSIIAGEYSGKVRAMFNERGKKVKSAGPATPVLILGLSGAPQAGEKIKETATEAEAREIASKRAQIIREQANRASKRISLEEIGRRLALGNFKELNLIVKGDVDGSVEALSDSLIKLSMEKIQVSVIHKAVGQIVDSDVMLASASDAIIIGFQVRPSLTARKLAEKEGVEIKLYSIIYEAIEEIKAAMEGMLEPTKEEEITGQAEVREVFKISKVGTVAGCLVQEGKINRNHHVRIVRDGIVIYPVHEGQHAELSSLKRFKEDIKEARAGLECGMTVRNFNDIKVGDVIESYVINEVKATL
ncbi:MAG: translation initiation factor IF-2 [Saprospiraceae bacterium]|nr:translation initiation factor IF-2 [Saprospiraceae bacterium]